MMKEPKRKTFPFDLPSCPQLFGSLHTKIHHDHVGGGLAHNYTECRHAD